MKYNKVISQHLSTISLFLIFRGSAVPKTEWKKKVINDDTFMTKVIESRVA